MTKQILAFIFLLHKRAKPILPPYLHAHLRARTQTLYSPLTLTLRLEPLGSIKPLVLPIRQKHGGKI